MWCWCWHGCAGTSCCQQDPALRLHCSESSPADGKCFDSTSGTGACLSRARGLREGQRGEGAAGRYLQLMGAERAAARALPEPFPCPLVSFPVWLCCLHSLCSRCLEMRCSHPLEPKAPVPVLYRNTPLITAAVILPPLFALDRCALLPGLLLSVEAAPSPRSVPGSSPALLGGFSGLVERKKTAWGLRGGARGSPWVAWLRRCSSSRGWSGPGLGEADDASLGTLRFGGGSRPGEKESCTWGVALRGGLVLRMCRWWGRRKA